eukprot:667836-Pelagomonas_calceolata.AAC.1
MHRENRRGDRGQPCLTPFVRRTRALSSPSIRIYSSSWYNYLMPGEEVQAWQCVVDGPKVANGAQCRMLERSQ